MKAQPLAKIESSPVALAEMSVDQLGASYVMLDRIAGEHDNANTVCRLLQGLVLTEAKRKISHGEFGKWLKKSFPKSQDTAGRCMRASEDFLQKLSRGKFRSTAEFDPQSAVDLLRKDLRTTLERLGKVQLDLAHPLVRAAALYAKGRSFYQLCLDLGSASRGGNQYERGGDKGKRHVPTADELRILSRGACENASKSFLSLSELKAFHALNGSELRDLLHRAECVVDDLKAFLKKPAAERELIFQNEVFKTLKHYAK